MLEITRQSDNEVNVCGLLSELEVVEGITTDGRGWAKSVAKVRVDQDINGTLTENEVAVTFFSMEKKKDGGHNKLYDSIIQQKEKFISAAAAEDESQATRVSIVGTLDENTYYTADGVERNGFQISAKFLNKAKPADKEKATFMVSGVVANKKPEIKNDEETGRLIVQMVVIGYGGKANVINMIADGSAAKFIEQKWEVGDTVNVSGKFNVNFKTVVIKEEQGFGEPIERERTVSNKELIITGGSPAGLEEAFSYDADDIKVALANRKTYLEETKEKTLKKAKAKPAAKTKDFDF